MPADQFADLDWTDGGTPVSRRFDDPYFSIRDGLAETRHVFLAGNGLPERFCPGFHIAELGFGTGLNMLAAWQAWQDAGVAGPLRFTSFEAFPMQADDMARALEAFPDMSERAAPFLEQWREGARKIVLPGLEAEVIVGDARATLPVWQGRADAWFLDGFAPARNPELWEESLLVQIACHSRAGASAATYTAAGFVRRGLQAAGFEVSRVPGFAHKRHMSVARLL